MEEQMSPPDEVEALARRAALEAKSPALLSHLDTRRLLDECAGALFKLKVEVAMLKWGNETIQSLADYNRDNWNAVEIHRNTLTAERDELKAEVARLEGDGAENVQAVHDQNRTIDALRDTISEIRTSCDSWQETAHIAEQQALAADARSEKLSKRVEELERMWYEVGHGNGSSPVATICTNCHEQIFDSQETKTVSAIPRLGLSVVVHRDCQAKAVHWYTAAMEYEVNATVPDMETASLRAELDAAK